MNEAETKDDYGDGSEERDRDLQRLKNAVTLLMEHFDTVHIFATRFISNEGGTVAVQDGGGNWYARRGQIGDWVLKQDASVTNDDD